MQTHQSTTPFGRRPMTLAMVASQSQAREAFGKAVHKWHAFRAICEGRAVLGISERALAVLNALFTFHPETILTGDADLVVFPSNEQLALRAHGMAASTLRRHLAALNEAGLVIRRDSPNGKRYVRRGKGEGEADIAFGFDLAPIVARAAEFEAIAEAVRTERRAVARLRERITVARRDVAKMAEAGLEEGVRGDWIRIITVHADLSRRLPRRSGRSVLRPLAEEFEMLAVEARILLEDHVKSDKTDANESQNERHIQSSNTDFESESEPVFQRVPAAKVEPFKDDPSPQLRPFPLALVLNACPDIRDYGTDGVSSWRDLVAAAAVARGALGISPSAYEEAQGVMGRESAAIVVAAILQKSENVRSAGAYVRSLTAKALEGGFSPGPMLMALLKTQTDRRRRA